MHRLYRLKIADGRKGKVVLLQGKSARGTTYIWDEIPFGDELGDKAAKKAHLDAALTRIFDAR